VAHSANKKPDRYEASSYGPIGGMAFSIFPPWWRFLVKVQPKLRPILGEEEEVEEIIDNGRLSFDSQGNPVHARAVKEKGIFIPDFTIVAVPIDDDLLKDRVVAILEIKRNHIGTNKARTQLEDYMKRSRSENSPAVIHGFLIMGKMTEHWILEAGELVPRPFDEDVGTVSDKFIKILQGIALLHAQEEVGPVYLN
jgi:hypothetical protein